MTNDQFTPEDYQQMSYDMYGMSQPDNMVMADALRQWTPYNAQEPTFAGLDQKERIQKLLEQKQMMQQQQYQQGGGQMKLPSMDMIQGIAGGAGGAGFGSAAGSKLPTEAAAPLPGGESFGSGGSATIGETGGFATGAADSSPGLFGNGGSLGGGWASAAGGALNGYMQGRQNYADDPNMWNGKDGYGKYHKDYRAEVGGGTLGGVLGYYGGPVGAAVAGPVVKWVHPYAEKGTRGVINFGDKVGGAGGALMLDPIGTVASGKYSWGELGKGALLGPLGKLF